MASRKTWTVPRFLVCLLFLYNLLDYILLVLESSLGAGADFTYSEVSCKIYQLLLHVSPLLTAGTVLLLVIHVYCSNKTTNPSPLSKMFLMVFILFSVVLLLSLPSLLFSGIAVYPPGGSHHCVLDLSGVSTWVGGSLHSSNQVITAIYYLLFKTVLPFWLPCCLTILPLMRLAVWLGRDQDKMMVNLNLALVVAISHWVFYMPHAVTVTIRQLLLLSSASMTPHSWWSLDVAQSLFLLISYFCHLFRPLACLLVDQDLLIAQSTCFKTGYSTVNNRPAIEERDGKI